LEPVYVIFKTHKAQSSAFCDEACQAQSNEVRVSKCGKALDVGIFCTPHTLFQCQDDSTAPAPGRRSSLSAPPQRPKELSIQLGKVRSLCATIPTDAPNDAGVPRGSSHVEFVRACARKRVHAWTRASMCTCGRARGRVAARAWARAWVARCCSARRFSTTT